MAHIVLSPANAAHVATIQEACANLAVAIAAVAEARGIPLQDLERAVHQNMGQNQSNERYERLATLIHTHGLRRMILSKLTAEEKDFLGLEEKAAERGRP